MDARISARDGALRGSYTGVRQRSIFFLPYSLGAAVQLLTTISTELFVRELKTVLFARSHSSKARSTALALKRLINGVTYLPLSDRTAMQSIKSGLLSPT